MEPISWAETIQGPILLRKFQRKIFFIFFKWANPGLFLFNFVLFSLQFQYKLKKAICVLGIWTQGRSMVGADETTELWRPPSSASLSLYVFTRSNCSAVCGRGMRRRFTMCASNKGAPLVSCKTLGLQSQDFEHIQECNTWDKAKCPRFVEDMFYRTHCRLQNLT